jgi:hypothetical protein
VHGRVHGGRHSAWGGEGERRWGHGPHSRYGSSKGSSTAGQREGLLVCRGSERDCRGSGAARGTVGVERQREGLLGRRIVPDTRMSPPRLAPLLMPDTTRLGRREPMEGRTWGHGSKGRQ